MSRAQLSRNQVKSSSPNEHATADDFQRLFASESVDLFRLAFLLTADAEKAEHCLILTMHQCLACDSVARDRLLVWTRDALIRNGIEVVTGVSACPLPNRSRHQPLLTIHRQDSAIDESNESAGILQLSDFDRLVYVICVLERCETWDCAILLDASRQEIRDARYRALRQITALEDEWIRACYDTPTRQSPSPDKYGPGFNGSCGGLLA
jgi:hypothetical protein